MSASEVAFQLECFASQLRSALEEGAKPVAFGVQPDTNGNAALVLHYPDEDGPEEYMWPDCLQETLDWLATLPKVPPA